MTDLVSLLFIAMVPIDFKITLICLLFFVTIIIFGELTSTISNKRMTTDIISQVPHPSINEKFICQ